MEIIRAPRVQLIALTDFTAPPEIAAKWKSDTDIDSQLLIEYAGRQCYASWSNPAGRTNAEYIGNMLDHGHLSVIEHANATFAISGVSRSLTHELVRHRHLSFSQSSQRYVPETDANFIEPDPIAEDPELHAIFLEAVQQSQAAYDKLLEKLTERFSYVEDRTLRRKLARQAARSVMPNATETKIVVTGNFRAWRWFIHMRGSEHADREIRSLAIAILRELQQVAPAVFCDYQITSLPDGSEVATSKYPY
jgi:thymidylate synthase (FAD)